VTPALRHCAGKATYFAGCRRSLKHIQQLDELVSRGEDARASGLVWFRVI